MPKRDTASGSARQPRQQPVAPAGARERARWPVSKREEFYADRWNFGYQVRDLHRMFRASVQAHMQPLGIPVSLWSYLWALYEEDGLIQNELARRVRLMGPSVVSAVNQMERLGLAQRRRNAEDRRTVNIHLTPKGWALRQQIVDIAAERNAAALQHLTTEEVETLLRMLAKVRLGLEGAAPRETPAAQAAKALPPAARKPRQSRAS
ncbi:MarR family winged helix-turn-helix transcriptional regulator [Muricoccus aerilatus]|uniref:MarR family winged helix-turn-helix transcriptional regulator n=1 Tax=Muricoccus aerilatus TaxID=452982 RepID=UPI0006934309|nr:MarR family winged helix-turn-helix transcriptional regulator [Roseomonas aerilata]